jgi:PhoPQ-activated pathogenicity-related protein
MSNQIFDNLNAFYAELWQHLDVFFDDHRWMRLHTVPGIEERGEAIKERYAILAERLQDTPLAEQIRRDMEDVEALLRTYQKEKPEPGSQWFKKADKMRDYLQIVGRRYGELALERVGS